MREKEGAGEKEGDAGWGERKGRRKGGEDERRKGVGSREKTWCMLQIIFIIRE